MAMETNHAPCNASAKLTIPASPPWFGTIRNLVIQLSRNCGVDDRNAGSIALVIDEAVSNIHRHGYLGSHEEMLNIEIKGYQATQSSPWKIQICIEDRAKQVELNRIKSRKLDDIRPGGLGVHLINTIMDTATWTHRKHGGMRLVMEKQGDICTHQADDKKESTIH